MPTKIAWADESWNPVTGCTPVSEGCQQCYAEKLSKRFGWSWDVTLHPDRLDAPLHWRKPRRVFVCSMGDLFHEDVPDEFLRQVFSVIWRSPRHTFQVLTKRPRRMREIRGRLTIDGTGPPPVLPNLWLGVSVENQARADERIPILMETPAAVRFVSAEPLLGPLDLSPWLPELRLPSGDAVQVKTVPNRFGGNTTGYVPALNWVIVGGESGGPPERRLVERVSCTLSPDHYPKAHSPCHYFGPDCQPGYEPKPEALRWLRDIRDQCQAAGVPFFLKQLGPRAGQGTLLDGREWQEMPEVRA